ncbi:MAG: hypothetical protein Q8O64_12500, partial [Sideroxyarcus sp.]|nr:hypothetical protein [Sideroxyarcus sp.]
SRSSSDSYKVKSPSRNGGAFCFMGLIATGLNAVTTRRIAACCGDDSHQLHRCDVGTKVSCRQTAIKQQNSSREGLVVWGL